MKSLSFAGYAMVLYSGDEPWANWRALVSLGNAVAGFGYDNINFPPLITMLFFNTWCSPIGASTLASRGKDLMRFGNSGFVQKD